MNRTAPEATSNQSQHEHLEAVCHAIAGQLQQLASERSSGALSEEAFISRVLALEASQVHPHGLTLIGSHTSDDWTVFKIKVDGTAEICAAFEFLPETGEFRRASCACDE